MRTTAAARIATCNGGGGACGHGFPGSDSFIYSCRLLALIWYETAKIKDERIGVLGA